MKWISNYYTLNQVLLLLRLALVPTLMDTPTRKTHIVVRKRTEMLQQLRMRFRNVMMTPTALLQKTGGDLANRQLDCVPSTRGKGLELEPIFFEEVITMLKTIHYNYQIINQKQGNAKHAFLTFCHSFIIFKDGAKTDGPCSKEAATSFSPRN